jgi:hypothetical protein
MEPVRIKYYGLIWLTKSGYLIGTLIGASFVVVLLLMMYPAGYLPPFRWPWEPVADPDAAGVGGWFYNHFYELCLLGFLAAAIDFAVTLRCFARTEAGRLAPGPGRGPT